MTASPQVTASCPLALRHCRIPQPVAPLLGVLGELPWRWVHIGPIDHGLTSLASHRHGDVSVERVLVESSVLAQFRRFQLDLFGLTSPPPGWAVAARYHSAARLWAVYAVASRDDHEPYLSWVASGLATGTLRATYPESPPSAADRHVADRALDLLEGRMSSPGRRRPTLAEVTQIVDDLESLKAASPSTRWVDLAARKGLSERTLRQYRAAVRRHRRSGDQTDWRSA